MRFTKAGLSRRSSIGWSEGGIHAGERDKFGQKFFRARHLPQNVTAKSPLPLSSRHGILLNANSNCGIETIFSCFGSSFNG
jgi:hypothetical protein